MEIKIDDFDIFVITEIFNSAKNNLDCNTWNMTKKYCLRFLENDSRNNQKILAKFYQRISREVMPKLVDYGLVIITKNGDKKNIYNLILNNIRITKHKFNRRIFNCMALKIKGKWVIIEN